MYGTNREGVSLPLQSNLRVTGKALHTNVERRLLRRSHLPDTICHHASDPLHRVNHLTTTIPSQVNCIAARSRCSLLFSSLLFSKDPDKLRTFDEKGVRVNRRQCKADDTVILSVSKPRGPGSRSKNKINHLNPP